MNVILQFCIPYIFFSYILYEKQSHDLFIIGLTNCDLTATATKFIRVRIE